MFSNRKKRKMKIDNPNIEEPNKKRTDIEQPQIKIFKPIDLNFKYRKSIIKKCENCGNIVPNFVDTCPFCKNKINF